MTKDLQTEAAVVENPSVIGMITSPREQFERIRENPKIAFALAVVTIMTAVGMLLMLFGINILEGTDVAGLTQEEINLIALFGQFGFVAVGVFTPPIAILISTIIYIALARIAKSSVTFKQLFSMGVYLFIISALSLVVNGLIVMIIGEGSLDKLYTSLNSVINAGGALGAFLNTVEVFSIWSMIITAIGLQVVARFPKVLAWTIVIGFYAVTTIASMVTV